MSDKENLPETREITVEDLEGGVVIGRSKIFSKDVSGYRVKADEPIKMLDEEQYTNALNLAVKLINDTEAPNTPYLQLFISQLIENGWKPVPVMMEYGYTKYTAQARANYLRIRFEELWLGCVNETLDTTNQGNKGYAQGQVFLLRKMAKLIISRNDMNEEDSELES